MEAEGFRNMTYFLDRPDNMSTYTTTIIADKNTYPILLSNGNDVASGDLAEGKHFVKWEVAGLDTTADARPCPSMTRCYPKPRPHAKTDNCSAHLHTIHAS